MSQQITVQSNRAHNARVFRELEETELKTSRAIRMMWFDLGDDLLSNAQKEILSGRKSGRVYIISRRDRRFKTGVRLIRHRASAPGETHANLSGELRKAAGWKVHGNGDMSFGYGLTRSSPEYDEFVEFGTRNMEARPSLENAVNDVQGFVQPRFSEQMNREFGT